MHGMTILFKREIEKQLKPIILQAEKFCKENNKVVKTSYGYNESVLYAKFGGVLGIDRCSKIALKYCA